MSSIRPPFCRTGSKYGMRTIILPLIPDHIIYVELFFGSGAIFYNKKKTDINVINDLDENIAKQIELIKTASLDLSTYCQDLNNIESIKTFWNEPSTDLLTRELIRTGNGFNGQLIRESKNIFKPVNPFTKIKRSLAIWKKAIEHTIVETSDYEIIVNKYDNIDAFFFIDPPYECLLDEKRFGYAEYKYFDFERLASVLHNIKGRFLLTINDSPRTRLLFQSFTIIEHDVRSGWKFTSKNHAGVRKELLVKNY